MMKVAVPSKRNDWITRCRTDRAAVFEELYEAAFPRVVRYIRHRGGTLEDARDIFHEAMILFYEKMVAEALPEHIDPAAYVFGIARNHWRRCFRKKGISTVPLEGEGDIPYPTSPSGENRRHRLFSFLERAGRKCMDLLQAFYYHRFSMKEIAEEFGYSSERSATVQKYKCLEKVREKALLESNSI